MLTPQATYIALLVVQALHLLHHRVTKRHNDFLRALFHRVRKQFMHASANNPTPLTLKIFSLIAKQ